MDSWHIAGLSANVSRNYYKRAKGKLMAASPIPPLRQRYVDAYLRAANKTDIPTVSDPFSMKVRNAIWENVIAVDRKGRRRDSCSAYLSPVLTTCSRNLRLEQSATVTGLLWDKQNKLRIKGVKYVKNELLSSKVRFAEAKWEVLLTAGPYSSPKLLQLSGIGPRKLLQRLAIPVRVDLGVGMRTQSRPLAAFNSLYTGVPIDPRNDASRVESPQALRRFRKGRPGVLGTAPFFINGVLKRIGYILASFALGPTPSQGLNLPIMSSVCITNPKSFGSLEVRDRDPFSSPLVFLNLLGKQQDVQCMLTCLRKMRTIHLNMPKTFSVFNLSPSGKELNDTFVRENAVSGYHFVGGCAVGRVVSPTLQVRGVSGIRVVDASVFRHMPISAGPMGSTYMLAEYVAEKLTKQYSCHTSKRNTCVIWK